MPKIRRAAVADMFYPSDPVELQILIESFLTQANSDLPIPKALIAPHAGYIYSGPIAASAYACLVHARHKIKRVVLLGPSHHHLFQGVGVSSADYFETPLGQVPLDRKGINTILALPQVSVVDEAHAEEHSLEVQLPFLQIVLDQFNLVPIVVGDVSISEVAEVLETLWGGEETLIVISSDLSHYLDYETAKAVDQKSANTILAKNAKRMTYDYACGSKPIQALLTVVTKKELNATLIDLRNSGDTAGMKDHVVGYGAFHFG